MALTLNLVGDPEADALLASDPLALLIGMLLDQQVPMETAFAGPKKLDDRLGGLDVHKIAEMSPDDFIAVCAQPPAVHRFPKSMGERIQSLCGYIVEHYDGDTAAIWTSGRPSGKEVLKRLKALPGYGDQKARIFLALLGKQIGVQPEGWREVAGAYGDEGSRRSIADVVDRQTLLEVREFKQAAKAAAKAAKEK
ncbi:Fe-S cluster assembly protein HesB [Rhodococcus hoagii]|uniref:Fe-S cluster assembly protein HesB n=1 Tax=Rhodococcus hoagii TaxID=43767 RepID=A0AAE2W6B5_RHOHA|nr:Fe-S cluster assembly protein HesB [Prescottella equi]MBM4541076.1 Fe-S cluster assembly protein HesB [Prescottella equi]MBM4714633.1 Fe-S cluster assembly protein HesB [Prescottella equi]NKS11395.1 Fe-S cluster assembly protein HesB [Prescottella equi]